MYIPQDRFVDRKGSGNARARDTRRFSERLVEHSVIVPVSQVVRKFVAVPTPVRVSTSCKMEVGRLLGGKGHITRPPAP